MGLAKVTQDCPHCNESDKEFYPYRLGKCCACILAEQKETRQTDAYREQRRKYMAKLDGNYNKDVLRRHRYGIEPEDYRRMQEEQQGVCAICEQAKELVIDHCHETSVVRGLICRTCNLLLGYANDKVGTLNRAIQYLERTNE